MSRRRGDILADRRWFPSLHRRQVEALIGIVRVYGWSW